ncbi:MAG: tRNA threonylcarbamoyladenosine dehydratase [Brachyspira sp.]|nr:tRNA threonylcarbamoyladenosine dehydratase [Brachyspira sp.]
MEIFSRNSLYWGEENQNILKSKHVAVFGLGGVGGFCAESLARAGIGEMTIIDFDTVSASNINRQIVALHSTIGKRKTELFEERLKDINPNIKLNVINDFYTNEDFENIDFAADAIDTMRSKISLLETCINRGIPVISSMGAGNRIDPSKLYISDISEIENKNAPFVSNIIYQLKKRGIEKGITVVASREKPFVREKISETEKVTTQNGEEIEFTKITPASTPFVASCAGIFMAYYIVSKFIKQ